MMNSWSGTIYASGTITGNGNSGWLDLWNVVGRPTQSGESPGAFKRMCLRIIPADLATDETLDITIAWAYESTGTVNSNIHTCTQITATNVAQFLIFPGGESTASLVVATDLVESLLWPWWRFSHVLGGTTKSMQYTVYGALGW